ncbi:MAG: 7,8-dihydro-8-oxoguanine triphosphatase [Candidatus Saccharibacteria bacterium]|nr:7,8-dihydro-8-oxoguanine triphosphatase [Candidatus Saccharibacteria bacterium]
MINLRTLTLFLRDDEILLAMKKRGFGAGYYNGPGGKLESGETLEQAMVRECQEEISLTPKNWEKVAICDFEFPDHEQNMQLHVFVCRQWEGEPAESEEMAPEWFNIKEIPYDKMWHDDIVWFPSVIAGSKLLGRFIFNGDERMLSAELNFVEAL